MVGLCYSIPCHSAMRRLPKTLCTSCCQLPEGGLETFA